MKYLYWIGFILIIIAAGAIPVHQQKSILIKAKYDNVYNQLFKPKHWKNWQPDVKAAWQNDSALVKTIVNGTNATIDAPDLYINTKLNGFGLLVIKDVKSEKEQYSCTVLMDKNFSYTDINVIANMHGFKWLFYLLTQKNIFADIDALKTFLEDDKAYYGYPIHNTLAVDTNILVIKKTVDLKARAIVVKAIQSQLQTYIMAHHYLITQPLIADIHPTDTGDSVRIMMGIPIMQSPKPSGNIKLMQMHKLSRQVSVTYSGQYGNRKICYDILKKYIADHSLSTTEAPYEKYLDNKIPLRDSDYTHLQIIFPVQ